MFALLLDSSLLDSSLLDSTPLSVDSSFFAVVSVLPPLHAVSDLLLVVSTFLVVVSSLGFARLRRGRCRYRYHSPLMIVDGSRKRATTIVVACVS
jgi:hypothetical protein